ncbi:nuclear transport factor 2 family protein [Luteimonas saliphila]|uniref:nuclear transport factor 2 family protein n=1 Tax=Luteimonas saliphila TaxID=2804919 RepID=UPI00192E271F|nr:nuclear transport factor 2 family protein [Luteimonas saliphila]
MKDLNLPEPIAAYFAADSQDAQAVARCFTRDARVLDEGKTHSGLAAIEAWKTDSSARYTYTAKPHTLEKQGRTYVVTACVAGNFPGSPVDLRYGFTLERGKIATLEIAS